MPLPIELRRLPKSEYSKERTEIPKTLTFGDKVRTIELRDYRGNARFLPGTVGSVVRVRPIQNLPYLIETSAGSSYRESRKWWYSRDELEYICSLEPLKEE